MQQDIHPDYHPVVFLDPAPGFNVLPRSTMKSKESIEWEVGNEYPLGTVVVSSASHPFYTGKQKYVDSAGRVEKFQKKYNWDKRRQDAAAKEEAAKAEAAAPQTADDAGKS